MYSAPTNAAMDRETDAQRPEHREPPRGSDDPTTPGAPPHLPRQARSDSAPRQDDPAPGPRHADSPAPPAAAAPATTPADATAAPPGTPAPHQDPRADWSTAGRPPAPVLRHRRDGILPNVAAALSAHGTTLTGTAARADRTPALHPLVQDFLDTLTSSRRDRFTGRCAETLVISRHLGTVEAARSKRAQRKPMTNGEARKALKNAKLTARRIREDGDPLHGSYAGPCRACTALAAHFGIRIVDPATPDS